MRLVNYATALVLALCMSVLAARIEAFSLSGGQSITYPYGYVVSDDYRYKLTFGYTSAFGGSAYVSIQDYGSEWYNSLNDGYNCAGAGYHQNQWRGVGTTGAYAIMQNDGNFVLYSSGGTPGWSTSTDGNSGAWIAMQYDGNVVVYSSGGAPLWSLFGAHSC